MNKTQVLQNKIDALEQLLDVQEKSIIEQTDRLVESEARFKAIYEGANDAVMLLTEKGFFDCNPRTLEMFGFTNKEEFTRVHPADISPPTQPDGTESFPAAMERIKTAFETGSNRFDWVHRRVSGEDFPAEVLLSAFDLNGKRVLQATVRDITKRKQAELALQQREDTLRGIYMAAPVGIAVSSKRTMITINRRISEISGYAEEELVGHGARLFFVDDAEFERVGRELYGNLKQKGRASVEAVWKRKDGVHIDVLLSAVPIENTDHEVVTVLDITERKRAEEALRQSEEKFRVLFEQAADIILQLEITPEGMPVIREVNSATLRLLGYEKDELIGRPVAFINAVSEEPGVIHERRQNILSGAGTVFEAKHRCKDGTVRDFECSGTETKIGSKIFAMTVERDITARKRAEHALAESELNFRRMFEITSEGVVLLSPETNRVIAANPAMCKMFGYSEEEFRSLTPEDITPAEAKEIMRRTMKTLSAGGIVPDHEGIGIRKDGTKVNVIVSNRHMSWKGEPVFHVTFKDVTFLKAIQEQLQKKNSEVLEYTDTVTHDLKKPLTTMNIVLGLAEKGAFGVLNRDGVEAVDTAREASRYMQEMLEDLLACARLESGTQELEIEETGFRELVDTVTARLKYQIEDKKIIVDAPREDVTVKADKKQLTKVLMNLVGNAVNYIGGGPDKFIRIGWEQGNGAPVFMVADNGIGVPEASRKDIFKKFSRGSNVSGVQGTGLGLSIVKGIVEAHGGKVWFESDVGKGTAFYFTLAGKGADS
jgi:PAS domain S-box-containing protein